MVKYIKATAVSCMALALASVATSCQDKEQTLGMPENVIISEIQLKVTDNLPLALGADSAINYVCGPANATNPRLAWTSSNELVATVDADGVVTAHQLGRATITVTPEIGFGADNAVKSILVTVIPEVIKISSIVIENTDTEVYEGDDLQLNVTLQPADHTYSTLFWTSSDESIATVDGNGHVTGIKDGNVTITARAQDSGVCKDFALRIRKSIPAEEVTILPAGGAMYLFESRPLQVATVPADATLATLSWSSSDESVAAVDKNGVVFAKNWGTATITATCAATGHKSEMEMTVEKGFYIYDGTTGFKVWNAKNQIVDMTTQNKLGQLKVVGDVLECTVTTDAAQRVCPQLCDYSTASNTGWYDFATFPICAVMADDLTMACTWQLNTVNIEKTISVNANMTKQDLGNGKAVFYYDCAALADFAGDNGMTGVRAFVFKIGKCPAPKFNIYSIRFFRSVDEMNATFN